MKSIKKICVSGVCVLFFISSFGVSGQNISPDNTFGSGGSVYTSMGPWASTGKAVTIQADGKIVMGSMLQSLDYGVARFNTDGTLDNSFGTAGKAYFDNNGANDYLESILVQPDGRIVMFGHSGTYDPNTSISTSTLFIARCMADGTPDNTFGTNGKREVAFSGQHFYHCRGILQPDGKILMAGAVNPSGHYSGYLMRFNTDGTYDNTFGTGGIIVIEMPGSAGNDLSRIVLQPDGKIVAIGEVQYGQDMNIFCARYNTNGSPDSSFGTSGSVSVNIDSDTGVDLILQSDGKILLLGNMDFMYSTYIEVVRLDSDGTLDNSFGASGIVTTGKFSGNGPGLVGNRILLCNSGKIIVAGTDRYANQFALVQYNTDGTLDTDFDLDGILTGTLTNEFWDVLLQSDGKLVAVGDQSNASAVFRFGFTPVGFGEWNDRPETVIYPNPTTGILSVKTGIDRLEISDVTGKVVYSSGSMDKNESIDLLHLSKGVYFIKLFTGNKIYVQKIVKE